VNKLWNYCAVTDDDRRSLHPADRSPPVANRRLHQCCAPTRGGHSL